MKLLLSVKITIKDYFPKKNGIQYDNYICLISLNNYNAKINLSNLNNHNSIKHKVETSNSNIIYNLHIFNSNNNSLIGIYQLIINFDKIKNLNINDTLTQEEKAKLLIDPKTKRKIFDNITNMGDIYLILSTEIKILDKRIYTSGNKQNSILANKIIINDINDISEFNLTPQTFKKKQIIRTMKNDREALKRMDTYTRCNEININDFLKDENGEIFSPGNAIKKYKSLNTRKMKAKINYSKCNELYNSNNQYFNNSCTVIMSPKHSDTNYNIKKDEKIKTNRKKNTVQKKKVTILNLMEKKIDPSLYKHKDENLNILESNTLSKKFKNTSINFSKMQINNNSKKNSCSSLSNYHCNIKDNKKIKIDKNDIFKRKNRKFKNKIIVNLSGKNQIEQVVSERKPKKKKNKNKLNLMDIGRLNTEISKYDSNSNNNINVSNIFLQTETVIRKLSERKKDLKKQILSDYDLKKSIIEKGALIKENFNNNYFTEKGRGTFSPKLSLRIKFPDEDILYKEKKYKNINRYTKEKINKKVLTPKSNQIRIITFNNESNIIAENEQLKKKCFNLIDFYCLISKNIKKTYKNNIYNKKTLEIIKEKYNNLNKCKYKIVQIQNLNESKKIKNHANTHFEEEKLLNKIINIKLKENNIYENIFGNCEGENSILNKISKLINKKKEIFLNLVKNIVKFYGNISQIYNNDKIKHNLFMNLLNKYNIKEKISIDLNYINYINKGNNFDDKVITEVDEDKENEEEDEEKNEKNNDNNLMKEINILNNLNDENKININNNNNIFNDNNEREEIYNNNRIQEIKIFKNKKNNKKDNNISSENINIDNTYEENLNNLIEKILIEQFPENYETNTKFIHQEKNKYIFKNKIFHAYIEDNDIVLKEEINGIIDNNNKYTLNEFYQKYCLLEKNTDRFNFVYTKKIRQKYIKIKAEKELKELSTEKKLKNENSTTIETEQKQNTSISNSKANESND